MSRRAPKATILYWRDIPAQVNAKAGRNRAKKLLHTRFQKAIDRAAMRAKKTDTDAYLDDWRVVAINQSDDINILVDDTVNHLEQEYTDERLDKIVRNKGLEPDSESCS